MAGASGAFLDGLLTLPLYAPIRRTPVPLILGQQPDGLDLAKALARSERVIASPEPGDAMTGALRAAHPRNHRPCLFSAAASPPLAAQEALGTAHFSS